MIPCGVFEHRGNRGINADILPVWFLAWRLSLSCQACTGCCFNSWLERARCTAHLIYSKIYAVTNPELSEITLNFTERFLPVAMALLLSITFSRGT